MAEEEFYRRLISDDDILDADENSLVRSKSAAGDVINVRITRNQFREFFKKLEKKSKNMKTSLAHVAALIAQYHFKHYKMEEGPSDDNGGEVRPWMSLDPLYENSLLKRENNKKKLLRLKDDEIFKQLTGGSRQKPPPNASIHYGRDYVEVGIVSEKYAILHEGAFLRKTGDTRAEKRHGTPVSKTDLARRIIGLSDREQTELFEDYALYFRKELEDL